MAPTTPELTHGNKWKQNPLVVNVPPFFGTVSVAELVVEAADQGGEA